VTELIKNLVSKEIRKKRTKISKNIQKYPKNIPKIILVTKLIKNLVSNEIQ
jgi:hypothetical protein